MLFTRSNIAYLEVPKEDGDTYEKSLTDPNQTRHSLLKVILLIIIAIIAIFATVFSAVEAAIVRQAHIEYDNDGRSMTHNTSALTPNQTETQPRPQYVSCGHNPVEARARGCSFDVSSFAWLTPECYNDELTHDFISWSNWTWYTNEESSDNTQLSIETAMLGEQDTFVDWKYHMVHCTFMWRLQHLSMERGWVGRHLVNFEHTMHCQHALLLDAHENRDVRTPAYVMYPRCLEVGMAKGMYPGPSKV
ncbi:hypothetical protein D6C98_10572 [Aureobasidium pullulans]|nr:hypothetical protein D6C98_10572 [Aureobasidium pullulans]